MPTYDYVCPDCQNRFDVFMTYAEYGKKELVCPQCGGKHVRRRVPRVRFARSEESRLDTLASDFSDPSALDGLEKDPKALGRMMRKMGSEMGEEIPPEFDDVVDRLEKGQTPEEIEKEMPDLGTDAADGGDDY
jgi:putative FmdB family regulatory protein